MQELIDKLDANDLINHVLMSRENTKKRLDSVIGCQVLCYVLGDNFPLLGALEDCVVLPEYLIRNRNIFTCWNDTNGPMNRNRCLFNALACYKLKYKFVGIRKFSKNLFNEYKEFIGPERARKFDGRISLDNLCGFERCFSCKLQIYRLVKLSDEDGHGAELLRPGSPAQKGPVIFLDLFGDENSHNYHISLIKSISTYAKCWVCGCGIVFKKKSNYNRHKKHSCGMKLTPPRYRAGCFSVEKSVFSTLADLGFEILRGNEFIQDFTCFDLESLNVPTPVNGETSLQYDGVLECVSCAISSTLWPEKDCSIFLHQSESGTEGCLIDSIVDSFLHLSTLFYEQRFSQLGYLFVAVKERREEYKLELEIHPHMSAHYEPKIKLLTYLETKLEENCRSHCIYGFNSAKFDIVLIKKKLCASLLRKNVRINLLIKKFGSYALIQTDYFLMKDVYHMLSPSTSLDSFVKSMGVPLPKGKYPYEWLVSVDRLYQKEFVKQEDFFSTLRNEGVSDEDYAELKAFFNSNCKSMLDYTRLYNIRDTESLLESTKILAELWRQKNQCIVTSGMSLPGLAQRYAMTIADLQGGFLWLPSKRDVRVYDDANRGCNGGLSMVMCRFHADGKTKIRNKYETVRRIVGVDMNALYLKCVSDRVGGFGIPFEWRPDANECNFHRNALIPSGTSYGEIQFVLLLEYYVKKYCTLPNARLRHFYSPGGQVKVADYAVDACLEWSGSEEKWVYEHLGCYYHAHLDCDAVSCMPYSVIMDRREKLREKITFLKSLGYRVEYVWSCDFQRMLRNSDIDKKILNDDTCLLPNYRFGNKLSHNALIRKIVDGDLFGFGIFSLKCKPHQEEFWDEFPPFIYNRIIYPNDVGDFMRSIPDVEKSLKRGRKSLVSGKCVKEVSVISDLIKFYMGECGFEVKCHKFYEFKPKSVFGPLAKSVTEKRCLADVDPSLGPIGEMEKLVGNSVFGRTIMRKDLFKNNMIVDEQKASFLIRKKHFKHLEYLGDGLYECETLKKEYKENTIRLIGFWTLQRGKLVMLQYYKYMRNYLDDAKAELMLTDTDSFYYAISELTLEDAVLPAKRDEFLATKSAWFVDPQIPATRRTPGLVKQEFYGLGLIALSAKCYCAYTLDDDDLMRCLEEIFLSNVLEWDEIESRLSDLEEKSKAKIACKGVQKRLNQLGYGHYMNVLTSQKTYYVTNRGFRFSGGALRRYVLNKSGLSYIYIKRIVLGDGRTTICLKTPPEHVW